MFLRCYAPLRGLSAQAVTGTSGEGCDVPDLTLPGVQSELADACPNIERCRSASPTSARLAPAASIWLAAV